MNKLAHARESTLSINGQVVLDRAIEFIHKTAGVEVSLISSEYPTTQNDRADAIVEIKVNGSTQKYAVQIKSVDRFVTVGQVKNQLVDARLPGLLVAPQITAKMAKKCRELDLQFIDGNGNTYLHGSDYLVFVAGERPQADDNPLNSLRTNGRAVTAAGLRVVYAVLTQPEILNAPYREISEATGVSLGTVGGIIADLTARGYLKIEIKTGLRRLVRKQHLLDEWVANFPIKLRPKLNPKRFSAKQSDWWHQIDIRKYQAMWGGEVAADQLTGQLKPARITIYMHPEALRGKLTQLVKDMRLFANKEGEIEILENFGLAQDADDYTNTVSPLLVYADLIASLDPRNTEVADLIYKRHLSDPSS